jgi:hypothetical protein
VCSKRAFIVTDPPLFEMGMVDGVLEQLRPMGIAAKVFTDVEPDPTLGMVTKVRLQMLFCIVLMSMGHSCAIPSRFCRAAEPDPTLSMVTKVRLHIL